MTQRTRLTTARAEQMKPPASGRLTVYDSTPKSSLVLRITDTGSRSWYCVQRAPKGRPQWIRLGSVADLGADEARRRAAGEVAKVLAGHDPNAEGRAKRIAERQAKLEAKARARSMKEAAKAMAEGREGRCPIMTIAEDRAQELRGKARADWHVKDLLKVARRAYAAGIRDLADPAVDDLAAAWIKTLILPIGDESEDCEGDKEKDGKARQLSPVTAARFTRHLIALGRHAARRKASMLTAGRMPFFNLTGSGVALPDPAAFHPDEAKKLASDAALAMSDGLLWAFLLYTGCRFKEGAWARWDRIDLKGANYFLVPPSQAERKEGFALKGNKPRTVHLPDELVALLRPLKKDLGYLFHADFRTIPHREIIQRFRDRLAALCIPLVGSDEPEGGPRTERSRKIHSLRHTHAYLMMAAGADSAQLRDSMGHGGPEMQQHYSAKQGRWRTRLKSWKGTLRLRPSTKGGKADEAKQEAG